MENSLVARSEIHPYAHYRLSRKFDLIRAPDTQPAQYVCAPSFCSFKHWIYNCEINLSNHTFAAFSGILLLVRSLVRSLLHTYTLAYTATVYVCVAPVCLPVFLSWLWLAIFYFFFTLYFYFPSFYLSLCFCYCCYSCWCCGCCCCCYCCA